MSAAAMPPPIRNSYAAAAIIFNLSLTPPFATPIAAIFAD